MGDAGMTNPADLEGFEPQIKADEKRITQMVEREFETLKEAENG